MTDRTTLETAGGVAPVRWVAPLAVFSALAAALGYALAAIPNIELVTITIFVAGAVLGRTRGAMVGGIGMGIYSALSPFGSGLALPTLFLAQVLAAAFVGFAGGLLGGLWTGEPGPVRVVTAAVTGLLLTTIYQLAVIIGYAVVSPDIRSGFWAALAANLFFPYLHIIWNTVLFAVLVPRDVPRIRRRVARMMPAAVAVACGLLLAAHSAEAVAQEPFTTDPASARPDAASARPDAASARADTASARADTAFAAADTAFAAADTAFAAADTAFAAADTAFAAADTAFAVADTAFAVADTALLLSGPSIDAGEVRAVALPGSLGFERWPHPLAVRETVGLRLVVEHDPTGSLDAAPCLRAVSSGWSGQWAAVTRGGLPPTIAHGAKGGRTGSLWHGHGLALLDAVAVEGGAVLVPGGIDLSWRSATAAGILSAAPGGGLPTARQGATGIQYHSGRRYSGTPYSRIGMASGDAGRRSRSIEFGSALGGRTSLSVFSERKDGRGPGPGAEHGREILRAAVVVDLASGWSAEINGASAGASRCIPRQDGVVGAEQELAMGAADLVLTDGRTRLGVFHEETRLTDRRPGSGDLSTSGTGVTFSAPLDRGPVRSLRLAATGLSASGELLAWNVAGASVAVAVESGMELGSWTGLASVGMARQRGEILPELSCLVIRGGGTGPWMTLDIGGRFPTALELAGAERAIVGDIERRTRGNASLDPEHAATVGIGWAAERRGFAGGATIEASQIWSPTVLADDGSGALSPTSGEDATAGMASIWGEAAAPTAGGFRAAIDLIRVDENGPLNALTPVPWFSAHASLWLDRSFFKNTLDGRLTLSAKHERGLARGDWAGEVEDTLWRTSVRAEGSVGPAHFMIAVDDPLDIDSGGWPGRTLSEPRVTYAFTWDFWN